MRRRQRLPRRFRAGINARQLFVDHGSKEFGRLIQSLKECLVNRSEIGFVTKCGLVDSPRSFSQALERRGSIGDALRQRS